MLHSVNMCGWIQPGTKKAAFARGCAAKTAETLTPAQQPES
jgi:hypothetical protein